MAPAYHPRKAESEALLIVIPSWKLAWVQPRAGKGPLIKKWIIEGTQDALTVEEKQEGERIVGEMEEMESGTVTPGTPAQQPPAIVSSGRHPLANSILK